MAVVRWTLSDGINSMTVRYNPYNMTSPFGPKNLNVDTPLRLVTMQPKLAHEWSFDGYVYTTEEYNRLKFWHDKDTLLELTDHLGRKWQVVSSQLDITDRRDTAKNSQRYQYTWTVLNLRKISVDRMISSEWDTEEL